MRYVLLFLPLLACVAEQTTRVRGTIYAGSGAGDPPLAGAEVTFLDEEGERLDRAITDDEGAFSVVVPSGFPVFVEIRADGFATTAIPGVIGLEPVLQVEEHALYAVPADERDALYERYAGCPGAEPGASIVFGEMRVYGLVDPETGESPLVTTGEVTVLGTRAGQDTGACYLDDEGLAYAPDSDVTGLTGQFAAFDVPAGRWDLEGRYAAATDLYMFEIYRMWVPEDEGSVSPWFPVWVPFPI